MLTPTNDELFVAPVRDEPKVPLSTSSDFLDSDQLTALTPAKLTQKMIELEPEITRQAAKAERMRRPVPTIWSAIQESGFFYQFVPKEFGGLNTTVDDFIDSALPISRACPSTGWNACFCAGHNILLAHFPRYTQRELWRGDFPYIISPLLTAPPGRAISCEGGFRVSGCWGWGSGVMNADWIFAMVMSDDPAITKPGVVLIPTSEVTVLDTWHMDGLKGSGSNTVVVKDIFVPTDRAQWATELYTGRTETSKEFKDPIYRTPLVMRASFFATVAVVGAAQGAAQQIRSALHERQQTNPAPQEIPTKYSRLGQADLMVKTAEILLRETARKMLCAPDLSDNDLTTLRIEARGKFSYAVKLCRDAALLSSGAGANVHRLDAAFQRYVRDINLMASHAGFDEDQSFELQGRSLLDLEPNTPMF